MLILDIIGWESDDSKLKRNNSAAKSVSFEEAKKDQTPLSTSLLVDAKDARSNSPLHISGFSSSPPKQRRGRQNASHDSSFTSEKYRVSFGKTLTNDPVTKQPKKQDRFKPVPKGLNVYYRIISEACGQPRISS